MARKLVSNIILGIIGVLALTLIVMAIVPKSFSVGVSSKPYQIAVYNSSGSSYGDNYFTNSGSRKDTYQKLSKLYRESFSTTSLDALFSKIISEKAEYEAENIYLNTIISNANSKGAVVMEFMYNELQTLKKDGKAYKNNTLQSPYYDNNVLKYGTVWIVVNDSNGFGEIEFYFQKLESSGNPMSSSTRAVIKVTTIANTHNLYKELKEIQG